MSTLQRPAIRVLLVDDHELVRAGLRVVLGQYPQIEVVGEAGDVAQAVNAAVGLRPDVIVMDVRLPDGTGFDACRLIRQQKLDSRVLFLTGYSDDYILLEAVRVQADGFLLKEIKVEELVAAIEKIQAGQSILDPAVTRRVLDQFKQHVETPLPQRLNLISPQEKRILALVAEGKTNKEIASALNLSDKTVKNYLANAMEKLGINRRSQAAAVFTLYQPDRA